LKRSLKGVIWVVSGDAGARLIGFILTAYLARILGPSNFGLVTIGLAVLAYLSQISGGGLQILETRNVALGGRLDRDRVGAVLALRFLLAVMLSAATGLVMAYVDLAEETRVVVWQSTLILVPLALSLDWFFQGKERFGILSISRILVASIYGGFVLITVTESGDYSAAILSLAVGTCAGTVLLLTAFRREQGKIRVVIDTGVWKNVVRKSVPVTAALLVGQSAVNLGPIVLGSRFGNAEAGMFSAAMKIIVVVLLLDRVLNSLFLPFISRIRSTRPDEFSSLVTLVFKGTFALVLPVVACCSILAPWIVSAVFGEGYLEAVGHLRFLLLYVVLTLLNSVLMCSMIASGEESRYSKLLLVGSLVLAVLVLLGAEVLGPAGASLGVGLGELFMFILLLVTAERVMRVNLYSVVFRYSLAGVAMIGTIVATAAWSVAAVIPAAITVFLASLVLLRGTNLREFRTLWSKFV